MWTLGAWSTDNNVFHFQTRQRDIRPVKPTGVSWRTMSDGSTEYYLDGELHSPNSSTPSQIRTNPAVMEKLLLFHANGMVMRTVRAKLCSDGDICYSESEYDPYICIGEHEVRLGILSASAVEWRDDANGRHIEVTNSITSNRTSYVRDPQAPTGWSMIYNRHNDVTVFKASNYQVIQIEGYRGRLDRNGFEFVEENRYHRHQHPEQTSADINFAVCEPPAEPERCAICLDALDASAPLFKTSCNHIYHQSCLRQSRTTNCPLCRCRYTEQPNTLEILKASALRQLREFDWSPREADLPFLTMGRPTLEAFLRGEYRPLFA